MSENSNSVYEFGPFRLDPLQELLLDGTRKVPLTPKAYQTLLVMVGNHGRIVTKDELLAEGLAGCLRRGGHSRSERIHTT